ncbi:MAG TPA: SdrD B-like domain-containing protein, partial [Methanotrichaceae archaeon]|nr:SdrD B-like domain-containing protein [Methanotrichaceae archaeon]
MIAAVVLSPAMGYTIQSAGNQSYSVQSEKVNYTISAGTPGHALTLETIPGKTSPSAAVQVTRVPYSFKPGGAVPYSMKLEGVQAGGVTTGITTPAVEPVAAQPVVTEVPPVTETPVVEAPVNETPVVEAPVNETPVVEAPVNETPAAVEEPAFSIMGKVFDDANGNGAADENETGLAGWTVSLEQPVGTIIANQTTAEDGSYAFMGLSAGEYAVSEIVQMGWTLVSPADGRYVVTVTNMTIANLDFANQMLPIEAPPENVTTPEEIPEEIVTPPENITE